jgi:hypothetical protein
MTARFAAAAFAISFALFTGADAAQPAVLRVEADSPITIAGNGFRKDEPVRVTIVMGTRRLADDAVASASGEFTVRFAATRLDRCATPLVVSAWGEQTGMVTATLPMRECAAP